MSRYEPRSYVIEPHWHVRFGKGTETLVYAESAADIAAWVERLAVTDAHWFDGLPASNHKATFCSKNDCKPRPRKLGTVEEYLKHPVHGWWRRLGLDDLV